MFNQIQRLLDSVALLLRGKTTPEEFRTIESAIRMYLDVDGVIMDRPYASIGDIPQLARQYRQQREAVPAAVLTGEAHEAAGPRRRVFLVDG